MTEDERTEIVELRERVGRQAKRIEDLEEAVAGNTGKIDVLLAMVSTLTGTVKERFDSVDGAIDKTGSWKTAIQFAAVIVVPVLIALIGGYFALRAGLPRGAR